jgi:hypothetical protein
VLIGLRREGKEAINIFRKKCNLGERWGFLYSRHPRNGLHQKRDKKMIDIEKDTFLESFPFITRVVLYHRTLVHVTTNQEVAIHQQLHYFGCGRNAS